ncbi:MAG: stage V sporulation protein AC [Clostridiales bacterium]|nr:stage V sporulation protein AC [Clostridiales bacterium]
MSNKFTNKEYQDYIYTISPNSKIVINVLHAFWVGGTICVVGQFITNLIEKTGASKEISSGVTTLIMILIGAILTGLNVYHKITKFAGAGSIVPITGFANSIVAPAIEYKNDGYVMGVGAKMFSIAGPVLVYGITSSVIAGIIYYLI